MSSELRENPADSDKRAISTIKGNEKTDST